MAPIAHGGETDAFEGTPGDPGLPAVQGRPRVRPDARLICHACRLRYAVQDDIPIMLIEEAERMDAIEKPTD